MICRAQPALVHQVAVADRVGLLETWGRAGVGGGGAGTAVRVAGASSGCTGRLVGTQPDIRNDDGTIKRAQVVFAACRHKSSAVFSVICGHGQLKLL